MVKKEISHFKKLTFKARELIFSSLFYGAAAALIGVFIGAYIFRQTNDPLLVSLYYVGAFISLYVTFLINGKLLKKIKVNHLYGFGLICMGLAPFILVSIPSVPIYLIPLIGALDGFGGGFYWSNRNYLEIDATEDADRDYFFGVITASTTFLAIIFPFLGGIILTYGNNLIFQIPSYQLLMGIGFMIFLVGALVIQNTEFHQPQIGNLFLGKASKSWNRIRLFTFFFNFKLAIETVAFGLIVLAIAKTEFSLGLFQSLSAVFSAIFIYIFGRNIKIEKRIILMLIGILFITTSNMILVLFFSIPALIVFTILNKVGDPISSNIMGAIVYKGIEDSTEHYGEKYRYICDLELFHNLGRLVAIALFVLFIFVMGVDQGLRFAPAIIIFGWTFLAIVTRSMKKKDVANA